MSRISNFDDQSLSASGGNEGNIRNSNLNGFRERVNSSDRSMSVNAYDRSKADTSLWVKSKENVSDQSRSAREYGPW